MNNIIEQNQQTSLLDEIFLTPSKKIMADRFSPENQASIADCSGKCDGRCHPIVGPDF
jgi:hypothetical protein